MKKIKHFLSFLALCAFSLLFYASGPGTTKHITSNAKPNVIKELKEGEQYDLVDLTENKYVRIKGTGQSITEIYPEVENLTNKKIKVVIKPGTFFVAGRGYQNMVTRQDYTFTLGPLQTKDLDIEATCINAPLAIPTETNNFYGVKKVSDNLERFLEACSNCDPMVVQAGVWAITDRYTGREVQRHLEQTVNGVPMGSPVSKEDIAEARRILKSLGIRTRL